MFITAIAFFASTAGMLVAMAVDALRRQLGRRFGGHN